jgi:hypothetical protein
MAEKKLIFHYSLGPLAEKYHPKIIVESGTHSGRTAAFMCSIALKYNNDVEYYGFDLFDMASEETHKKEINGKGTGSYEKATAKLDSLKSKYPKFKYKLHKGFTTKSFKDPIIADLVYIDGGHSTESVLHDYSMVKDSKVIVFDDYQMESVVDALKIIGITDQVEIIELGKTKQAIYRNF